MKKSCFLFLCVFLFSCTDQHLRNATTTSLLQAEWTFSKLGEEIKYKAQVPGEVHTDLYKNKLIDDPYFNNNELDLQWIELENWDYVGRFDVGRKVLKNTHIELQFDGLDTYAKVYLNGEEILSADNMFRSWRVEIKKLLQKGSNELRIVFTSPINFNKEKVKKYPHHLPAGNEADELKYKVSPFTRKAAYQFGWDWGPRFVGAGIWRPIYLNTWNDLRILNVSTHTIKVESEIAFMSTQLEVEADEAGDYTIVSGDDSLHYFLKEGINTIKRDFQIEEPNLWWCNGKGDAFLYTQLVKVYKDQSLLDFKRDKYGVRTIELIHEKDSIGTSFYFKLNGEAVFIKGANYIPQDIFPSRVPVEKYQSLLHQVKDANMNMLRVWGGGIYESDRFYKLCDELGILVWQDFMFAGSLYPDNDKFKDNIRQEVEDNVKRLRNHPSIAIWCGNNEIEVAWKNWGWQKSHAYSKEDSTAIWDNYLSIFHDLIPSELSKWDERPYVSTTPLSNWGNAENFNHASMHYWGVWHGKEDFDAFENNVGRFMVEYGFQSFPSYESLTKCISDSLLYLDSEVMSNRQKSYIGNGMISDQITKYFHNAGSFEEFIELSQKTQALALQKAIRAHMQKQPHCMGSLFWQLNDCWPGPSWSVIDYYGKEKIAYDTVKKEFATQ